jgi:hypothetical protein
MIEEINDKSVIMKVAFDNPEFISMLDQSIQDRLVVELTGPAIIGKNGLPLSMKRLNVNPNGDLET